MITIFLLQFTNIIYCKPIIQKNRIKAMKRRLTSYDFCSFNNVPNFIVEAFFGKCTYSKRLIASTFGYLNGILLEQVIEMQQWTDITISDRNKMDDLMNNYFKQPRYRSKYYSFEIIRGLVCYLDGTVRYYGRRLT
jgi:hypothetical protein